MIASIEMMIRVDKARAVERPGGNCETATSLADSAGSRSVISTIARKGAGI